ncbi:MAG TPA: TonB-dependent receptor, partial [Gemmatimonadaceae bacterium]
TTPVTLPAVRTSAERVERQEFTLNTNVGKVSITRSEARSAPVFVEPDVLRAVQMLPGIAARNDYTAGFNVRGGEADQNLILIDGYPIFNPFHFGGVFSTFIDPAVGRVNIYTGALPARFGGRLSSVLSVESANATTSELRGTAELSLISSNASLGRTFHDGQGSWMIAARRTYADAVVNLFKRDAIPYHFTDVQGHLETPIGGGVRLSVTAYDGIDEIARQKEEAGELGGAWGNGVIGATLSKTFARGVPGGDSLALAQRVSTTRYDVHIDDPRVLFRAANRITDVRTGGSVTLYRPRWTHEIGYELSSVETSYYANGPPGFGDLIPFDSLEQRSRSAGVYGDLLWRPMASLIIDGGVRVDALDSRRGSIVSPRLSLKYFLTPDLAFIAATGRYAQWLHSLGREEQLVQPFQFWVSSASAPSVSRDAVVGVEHWLSPSRVFHVEAFHKRYERVLVPASARAFDAPGDDLVAQSGTSYGADVRLRQLDGGPFSGWLAYTYAVSTRVSDAGARFFPGQDRRHDLNLVGSWRTGAYSLGARVHAASGAPYTPGLGALGRLVYDPTTKRWVPDQAGPQDIRGDFNSARVPFYHRVDVSVRRNGHIRGASFAPYLSIVNILNAKNPAGYVYDFTGQPKRMSFPNLPFAPTFGVSIGY